MIGDKDKSPLHTIGVAVAIAGLTALVTNLVEWGVDALRDRFDPKKPAETPKDEKR